MNISLLIKRHFFIVSFQTFLEPQHFEDITFNDNLQLYGLINGFELQHLVDDTVNKSDAAVFKHVTFGNFHIIYTNLGQIDTFYKLINF